ncbi:MAG: c-type cytochrome [Nitrospirae bacterium]|nr:c-type cytochrome [Nitrospirota bacterium]
MSNHDRDARDRRSSRLARLFLLIGGVLLVLTLLSFWLGSILAQKQSTPQASALDPALVPLVTGTEPIPEIFTRAGCSACHTIPGIPGAEGRVGPKLVLGSTGPLRLGDPAYRGQAKTVHEYVIESILSPGAYMVPGFPAQAMPRWYGQKLSAGALEKMAAYLESLADEQQPDNR